MDGTRILITGAANGIGRALAARAVEAGANVILVDREVIDTADLRARDDRIVLAYQLDLTDISSLQGLATFVEETLGALDAVVHAAGVFIRPASIDDVTEADFDAQIAVNQKAPFFLVTRLRRLIVPGGSIVLFSSMSGVTGGSGGMLPYASTNAGVNSLTLGLARELAPAGVRVNAIAPGFVDTGMMRGFTDQQRSKLVSGLPLGRIGTPEEMADAAIMLLGPGGAYMTAAVLDVDGGGRLTR